MHLHSILELLMYGKGDMSGKEQLTPRTKRKSHIHNSLKPKENICKTVKILYIPHNINNFCFEINWIPSTDVNHSLMPNTLTASQAVSLASRQIHISCTQTATTCTKKPEWLQSFKLH